MEVLSSRVLQKEADFYDFFFLSYLEGYNMETLFNRTILILPHKVTTVGMALHGSALSGTAASTEQIPCLGSWNVCFGCISKTWLRIAGTCAKSTVE